MQKPTVFVNYRRDDEPDVVGRICDHLKLKLGPDAVFQDVDSLFAGEQFGREILRALERIDVFLAVIGRRWTGPREGGRDRIHDPDDWVRIEVEKAIEVGLPIIPVMVNDAPMPRREKLPPSIHRLTCWQDVRIGRDPDFHVGMDRLLKSLDRHLRFDSTGPSLVGGIDKLPFDYDRRIQNFLFEYLGTDEHPVAFGGRQSALSELDAWLTDQRTPYLLVTGPAGRGKSALLIRWLMRRSEEPDLALAFVPISLRFETSSERVFYAALAARLAFLHRDKIGAIWAIPEASTAVLRGLVSDYLSRPLDDGRTLVLVVDGLDEASDWEPGPGFAPTVPPEGVKVVVAARNLADDIDGQARLRRLNWGHRGLATTLDLAPLDQDEVGDVLAGIGYRKDLAGPLHHITQGDPLLLGLYIEDFSVEHREGQELTPEYLTSLKPGYPAYFDRWWREQQKLWGKEKPWLQRHVLEVRNVLAGALEPLLLDEIGMLLPDFGSAYVRDALDVLWRFVIGSNYGQGYAFSHPKLGYYFWNELTSSEQDVIEERFLFWGERILDAWTSDPQDKHLRPDAPRYIVRNYGAHLVRCNSSSDHIYRLVSKGWMRAWHHLEGAYSGFLRDVERAWGRADLAHDSAMQVRCVLCESSIHSIGRKIQPDLLFRLVKSGRWEIQQALAYIPTMLDEEQRACALHAVSPFVSIAHLPAALRLARAVEDPFHRSMALVSLARRGTHREHQRAREDALASANAIHSPYLRAEALSKLARYLDGPQQDEAFKLALEWTKDFRGGHGVDEALKLAARLPRRLRPKAFSGAWAALETMPTVSDIFPTNSVEDYAEAADTARLQSERNFAEQRIHQAEVDGLGELDESNDELLPVNASPEEDVGEALAKATLIDDGSKVAEVLGQLAHWLSPDLALEILDVVNAETQGAEWARIASAFAFQLPEPSRSVVLERIGNASVQDGASDDATTEILANITESIAEPLSYTFFTIAVRLLKRSVQRERAFGVPREHCPLTQRARECCEYLYRLVVSLPSDTARNYRKRIADGDDLTRVIGESYLSLAVPEEEQRNAIRAVLNGLPADILHQNYRWLHTALAMPFLSAIADLGDLDRRAAYFAQLTGQLSGTHLKQALLGIFSSIEGIKDAEKHQVIIRQLTANMPNDVDTVFWKAVSAIKNEKLLREILFQTFKELKDSYREDLLENLSTATPPALVEAVVEVAGRLEPKLRIAVTSGLLPNLSEERRQQIAEELLALTDKVPDEYDHRSSAACRLVPHLSKARRSKVEGRIRKWARSYRGEWWSDETIINLARHVATFDGEKAAEIVDSIVNVGYRASALSALLRQPCADVERLVPKAFDIALKRDDCGTELKLLDALSNVVSPAWVPAFLRWTNRYRCYEWEPMSMLETHQMRVSILMKVTRRFPGQFDEEVLDTARGFPGRVYMSSSDKIFYKTCGLRAYLLSMKDRAGIEPLPRELRSTLLRKLANQNREDLLADLAVLLPFFVSDDSPADRAAVYQAIRDVTTWLK